MVPLFCLTNLQVSRIVLVTSDNSVDEMILDRIIEVSELLTAQIE